MLKNLNLFFIIILFISAFYFFITRLKLYHFLVKHNIKVIFGLSGMPGYLETLYIKSDKSIKNTEGKALIFSLKVSFIFILISSIFIGILIFIR